MKCRLCHKEVTWFVITDLRDLSGVWTSSDAARSYCSPAPTNTHGYKLHEISVADIRDELLEMERDLMLQTNLH